LEDYDFLSNDKYMKALSVRSLGKKAFVGLSVLTLALGLGFVPKASADSGDHGDRGERHERRDDRRDDRRGDSDRGERHESVKEMDERSEVGMDR
jgi:hypothetical protein